MKTRQLLLVTALAELGSLREAAAAMYITQPAASKLIKDLEETMGVALFERHRRGMRPNLYGEVVIRHAQLVLTTLAESRREVAAVQSGALGHVRVGAVMGAIPFVLARTIAELKRDRPTLLVTVDVETSDRLVPALERGELDVLLARPLELATRPGFAYEQLLEEPLAIVARRRHPLSGTRRSLSLPALAGWPWILFPQGSPMRAVLAPLFHEMSPEVPSHMVETSSIILTTALLEQTDMLAVLPEDVARYYAEREILAIVPVRLPPVMGSYGIITRRDRPLPPGALAFLDALRTVCRELPTPVS